MNLCRNPPPFWSFKISEHMGPLGYVPLLHDENVAVADTTAFCSEILVYLLCRNGDLQRRVLESE